LFASGDSISASRLVPVCARALRLGSNGADPAAWNQVMLRQVFHRSGDFDVLHFHLEYLPFRLFSHGITPFVSTLHGRLDLPQYWPMYRAYPDAPLVAVSDAQRGFMPWARWLATVHHGIPRHLLMPTSTRPTYLAFLGRIAPEKRVDRAVEIAGRCGLPLKIAAKVDRVDREYFEDEIRPLLALPHVEFLGEIGDAAKAEFLSGAVALVFPGDWPEPFGLVMIEAMACGTPVIALEHGSVAEVVERGLTGFVVRDVTEAVKAVSGVAALSRAAVRRRFEERFTADRMAQAYLAIYHRLACARM
jgi:glycosyltransferase involved in cell wall biosynthesis